MNRYGHIDLKPCSKCGGEIINIEEYKPCQTTLNLAKSFSSEIIRNAFNVKRTVVSCHKCCDQRVETPTTEESIQAWNELNSKPFEKNCTSCKWEPEWSKEYRLQHDPTKPGFIYRYGECKISVPLSFRGRKQDMYDLISGDPYRAMIDAFTPIQALKECNSWEAK